MGAGSKSVLAEVSQERDRQDEKWGEQNHPDLSPTLKGFAAESVFSAMNLLNAKTAKARVDSLAVDRLLGYADIALEEFTEAIEAAANEDTAALRTELVQTAAVLVAWVECIDRRQLDVKATGAEPVVTAQGVDLQVVMADGSVVKGRQFTAADGLPPEPPRFVTVDEYRKAIDQVLASFDEVKKAEAARLEEFRALEERRDAENARLRDEHVAREKQRIRIGIAAELLGGFLHRGNDAVREALRLADLLIEEAVGPVKAKSERFVLLKRGFYWRPNACGYSEGILYAGTYSREEADAHVSSSSGEVTMMPLELALKKAMGSTGHTIDSEVLSAMQRLNSRSEGGR